MGTQEMNRSSDRPQINWEVVNAFRVGDVVVEVTASDQQRPRYSYSIGFAIQDPRGNEKIVRSRQLRWEGSGDTLSVVNQVRFSDLASAVSRAEEYIAKLIADDDKIYSQRQSRHVPRSPDGGREARDRRGDRRDHE